MDSETVFQDCAECAPRSPTHPELPEAAADVAGAATSDGCGDDVPEGCTVAEERVLADPWGEPAPRRAMAFLALRKVGSSLSAVRIDPLPMEGAGRNLHWLFFAPQTELDIWRASDTHADMTLMAVSRWLGGDFLSFGRALAASFPLQVIQDALLECLDARAKDVLRRRVAGDTLDAIAEAYSVSRERIRQLETAAVERLAGRITALSALRHPVILALFGHAARLASIVLAAASQEEGILREEAKRRWIRKSLSQAEAEILLILLRLSEDMDPDLRSTLDPLSTAGWPFQGGRTALPWRDEDVASLKAAFALVVGDRTRRFAKLDAVCTAARLAPDMVAALARFASLTLHGDWLFEGRLKVSDIRCAMLTDVLAGAGRAMNEAEILEELVPLGFSTDATLGDIHRIMSEDGQTFVSDGKASWQLRSQLGELVDDRRPEHPILPSPMDHATLKEALAALSGAGPAQEHGVLDGLSPGEGAFAHDAGNRLANALAHLPETERASIAQILRPADEEKLHIWLGLAEPQDHAEESQPGARSPRVLEGLTMLAAFVATVRATANSDGAHWSAIFDACGERARNWIFNSQQAPRRRTLSRLVEVATSLRLRRAFSFQSDPWSTLLTLQAGLLRRDMAVLPRWLSNSQPPVAIRQLVAPGPNHSASMACTWNALQAYRRGYVGRDVIETLFRRSEWWPGWSVDEASRACVESLPDERPSRVAERVDSSTPTEECRVTPAEINAAINDANTIGAVSAKHLIGSLDVSLEADGRAFSVALPQQLQLAPGAVALVGMDFRLGGVVNEDGSVSWHTELPRLRLKLRGPSERPVRLERGPEILASQSLRLWAADDYIVAFALGGVRSGRTFDPFVSPLPRSGGVALLLHRSLELSAPPDEQHGLDESYVLNVFRSGIPQGATVSCDGEVLWVAEQQPDQRRVVSDLAIHLTLVGGSLQWGRRADLMLARSRLPDGNQVNMVDRLLVQRPVKSFDLGRSEG